MIKFINLSSRFSEREELFPVRPASDRYKFDAATGVRYASEAGSS